MLRVTDQMRDRGEKNALIPGAIIALASGGGVALSITNGGVGAVIGVAISASLLPPVVNTGLLFGLTLINSDDYEIERALLSLALFGINVICIMLSSILFFKIKGIGRKGELNKKSYRREFFESVTTDELANPVHFLKPRARQRYKDQTLKEVNFRVLFCQQVSFDN